MPGTAKVRGLNLTRTFSNGKYSISNKIVCQLFFCLSVVDLVVTCWNRFFWLRAFFFNVALSVYTSKACVVV